MDPHEDALGRESPPLPSIPVEETGEAVQHGSPSRRDGAPTPTLQSIQEAINTQHPFGLRIWKPALYKKLRSIDSAAETALLENPHGAEQRRERLFLSAGNLVWLATGCWITACGYFAVATMLEAVVIGASLARGLVYALRGGRPLGRGAWAAVRWFDDACVRLTLLRQYARVSFNLAWYMLWPFGRFVRLLPVPGPAPVLSASDDDEDGDMDSAERGTSRLAARLSGSAGREFNENDADESTPLLGHGRGAPRLSAQGPLEFVAAHGLPGAVFYVLAAGILAPLHVFFSAVAWLSIFSIPMAKLHVLMLRYILTSPLRLRAERGSAYDAPTIVLNRGAPRWSRDQPGFSLPSGARRGPPPTLTPHVSALMASSQTNHSPPRDRHEVILCIYHAMGWRYYKYTLDGINIVFVNLMATVALTLLDGYVLMRLFPNAWFAQPAVVFSGALLSVIPLAYFIGMAVSSITAQTGSLAVGAVINATFGSVIEIILYGIALLDGKAELVNGAIVGSFLCGLLALPGISMVSGALHRKEQRFNAKSAGVTATMLIVAVAGCFTPTFFQSLFGAHELKCASCTDPSGGAARECAGCRLVPRDPTDDPVYQRHTKPLMYFCATLLVLMYVIGLWFTLRTHAGHIYKPRAGSGRRRRAVARNATNPGAAAAASPTATTVRRRLPSEGALSFDSSDSGSSEASTRTFLTASTPAPGLSGSIGGSSRAKQSGSPPPLGTSRQAPAATPQQAAHVGHDSPNWSSGKSIAILLLSTLAFSLLAELIVGQIDHLFDDGSATPAARSAREKLLGLTLFALVPNVTEFYNAIAFAMYGNVGLSLEIGSAYVVQVALLQVPVLVGFTATLPLWCSLLGISAPDASMLGGFSLIFPYWDTYATIFSVFLLAYLYNEGKSNYFKGSMLLCCYAIILASYFTMPNRGFSSLV